MQKRVVVCLNVGTLYTDDYVYKLYNMVKRHTTFTYDFICVSDHEIPGIDTILIDSTTYPPLWYKLQILDDPTINQYDHKVFFDLDVVIHDNVDWCFAHIPTGLSIIRSLWKPESVVASAGNTGINSSVMIWHDARYVWNIFLCNDQHFVKKYKGIDRFLWNEPVKWSEIPRGKVYSFREGASKEDRERKMFRPKYSICIYNQHPKPHKTSETEPAKSFWI